MIKVLVVDDSAIVRRMLTEELSKHDDIQVVGQAVDPYVARDKIIQLKPDVLTLDIEMPRMDGLTFLERLMKHHPIPVVIVSSLAPENSETALRALALGAVEVVSKPGSQYSVPDVARDLVSAIRAASVAKLRPPQMSVANAHAQAAGAQNFALNTTSKMIAIGASTGGPRAIETVLQQLPPNAPGVLIVQHMPESFTAEFARRLDKSCAMNVREARDGDQVVQGLALIAPGNRHMYVKKNGATYQVRVKDGPPVQYQRPSVDVLFQSVAREAQSNAVGVLLTGMGADGARGLLQMKQSGAHTIAEHESTTVVYGMPGEAAKLGAVVEQLPLHEVAGGIFRALSSA